MKILEKEIQDGQAHYRRLYFYCPGCKTIHSYNCDVPGGAVNVNGQRIPVWSFNGDFDRPTFSPSLLTFTTDPETKERRTLCHLFVQDGKINYCGDCPHDHNGRQGVELIDIPDEFVSWFDPPKEEEPKKPTRKRKRK
jgi:hypothetical protein